MGIFEKDFFAIVLLALGKKGKLTGISIKLLWLQTITALGRPLKFSLPVTLNLQPDKNKYMPIHNLDTCLCHLVLFGSGNRKQNK